MDEKDNEILSDALERAVLEKAEKDGYQTVIRNSLKKFLNDSPSRAGSENLVWVLGVLSRAGYLGELEVWQLSKHIGILN